MNTIPVCKRCHKPCREHIDLEERLVICKPTLLEALNNAMVVFFGMSFARYKYRLYESMTNLDYLEYKHAQKERV